MSSLLDILQKKSARPASDAAVTAAESAASHMQTVELHLAVDNRGAEDRQIDSDTVQTAAPELEIRMQDEGSAPVS
ncbi:MAG: hypothetical protein KJ040_08170, partial [Gammaproteobacteria bacterium]|nr:hypothetical protein [Gammaproteobacteria bacterium]